MKEKKRKRRPDLAEATKEEIIEEALLKQVSGGEDTCSDDYGANTCFNGDCWGGTRYCNTNGQN